MKKILLVLIILFIPIGVFAGNNLDEVITSISSIKNVYVDSNIRINSVSVNDNNIIMKMLEEEKEKEILLDYNEDDYGISFSSGSIVMPISVEDRDNIQIINNNYAFYLYSIIENRTNTIYDEDTYYNEKTLEKIVTLLSEVEINNIINGNTTKLDYYNLEKVFGVTLEVVNVDSQNITFKVVYHRYYNSGYEINKRIDMDDNLVKNPNTGNMNIEISFMLITVIGLMIYTLYVPKKKGN